MQAVRNVYFPLMWADETATIDDESADLYKSKATTPLLLLDIFALGFGLGLGSLGVMVSLLFFTWIYYNGRKSTEECNKEK